jgi:hypothetical protein
MDGSTFLASLPKTRSTRICAKIDHHFRRVIATKTKGVKKVRKRIGRRSQEYSLTARVTMLNQHFLYLLRFTPFDHTEETLFHFF